MGRKKKKLSAAQVAARERKKLTPAHKCAKKAAKAEKQKQYKWIFVNGKQVRVKRNPTIDGKSIEDFIEH